MTFTTPCFVRVENPEKRKELNEWLNNIGRRPTPYSESDRSPWFTAYATGKFCQTNGFHMHPEMAQKNGYINCGENIELFKALAAMNYENYREQWFVEEGKMFKCTSDKINGYTYNWPTTRKATAEEIVEYFKNKER